MRPRLLGFLPGLVFVATSTLLAGCGAGPSPLRSEDGGDADTSGLDEATPPDGHDEPVDGLTDGAKTETAPRSDSGAAEARQDAGLCATAASPLGTVRVIGTAPTYDGPAVVERSASDGLVLAMTGAATATGVPRFVVPWAPPLPVGAQVWLSRMGESAASVFSAPGPWYFTVSDRRGGTILFGAVNEAQDGKLGPFAIGAYTPYLYEGGCPRQNTYATLEVLGADCNPIPSGSSTTIHHQDVTYQLSVQAVTQTSIGCGGLPFTVPTLEVGLTFQATNLSSLVATLDAGELPACHVGNAPQVSAYVRIVGGVQVPYDGPIVYRGLDPDGFEQMLFDLMGAQPGGDPSAQVGVIALPANLFPEPKVGDAFWATTGAGSNIGAIRDRQGGRILLATGAFGSVPIGAMEAADAAGVFGVSVALEKGCPYAPVDPPGPPIALEELVFGTTPPTRIAPGVFGTVKIGASTYSVRAWSHWFVLWSPSP